MKILHPSTLEPILERETTATFAHPFQEFNAIFRGSLSFPLEGRYHIILLVDGSIIAQRTLEVFVQKEPS